MRYLRGCFCMLVFAGCSADPARPPGRLTGEWYATGTSVTISETEMGVISDQVLPTSDRPQLILRDDGTFDLSITPLGEIEGVGSLRNPGDRVFYAGGGVIEVKRSIYVPGLSELVLADLPAKSETLFRAQAIPGDRLLFIGGSYGSGGSQVTMVMVLSREKDKENVLRISPRSAKLKNSR